MTVRPEPDLGSSSSEQTPADRRLSQGVSRRVGLPRLAAWGAVNHRLPARVLVTGTSVGLFALLAFGTVHALLITPIWTRLLGGAPFALVAGIALACAFEELHRSRGWQTVRDGARFGGVMFGALLPATAFDTALRLIGADRNGWLTTAADFALALLAGAAAGWILTRSRRATLACGTAAIALSCATAGPHC